MSDIAYSENKFRNPCWVTYLHPLTFIVPDNEKTWEVPLDEINKGSYNHGKLLRIVSTFKIQNNELDGLICYDGAIAIPKNKQFPQREDAVNFFNNFIVKLLFAGLYVEGIDVRDVVDGQLHDKWSIWPVDFGSSASSQMHSKIRMKVASNIDTIQLANPRILKVHEILIMLANGDSILKKIPNLSPKFLTKGISEIKYKNWDSVLSNLWIIAEQLIDFLWYNFFLANDKLHPKVPISKRNSSLKDDSRTWSAVVKQELLFQNKIITESILQNLFIARQVRNKLVHEGKSVSEEVAINLFKSISELFEIATKELNVLTNLIQHENHKKISFHDELFNDWKEISENKFVLRKYE